MTLTALPGLGGPAAPYGPLSVSALADIAAGLARTAQNWTDRIDEDSEHRTGLRLLATDAYDVWLLRWPPGTSVEPHDHGVSTGVFAVVTGELTEIRWVRGIRHARAVGPGEVIAVERGVVHDVVATADSSLSVHAYSPPLTWMSFYDDSGQEAVRHSAVDDGPSVLHAARILHPAGIN